MTERVIFTPEFFTENIQGLTDLARINDLLAMRSSGRTVKGEAIKNIFPDLPKQKVKEGILNTKNEFIRLKLQQTLEKTLKPWLETPNLDGTPLPTLTALELARKSGFSVAKVIELVKDQGISVSYGDKKYQAGCDIAIPPTQEKSTVESMRRNEIGQLVPCKIKITGPIRYTIGEAREASEKINPDSAIRINPKKIIRGARYESRSPRGGPVQRTRFQKQKVTGQIIKMAQEKARIFFEPVDESKTKIIPTQKAFRSPFVGETISISENAQVTEAISWFKDKSEVFWKQDDINLFTNILEKLAMGENVDFLIINCLAFDWIQDRSNTYPKPIIKSRLETSIIGFFAKRVTEMIYVLSKIGRPTVIGIIPTAEALASNDIGIWEYTQSEAERNKILDNSKLGLEEIMDGLISPKLPDIQPVNSCLLQVKRWDKYLEEQLETADQNKYTREGVALVENKYGGNEPRIAKAAREANRVFSAWNMRIDQSRETGLRQLKFEGVYAGEGLALQDMFKRGKSVALINFEASSIPDAMCRFAQFPIVTPAKRGEINKYYKWKKQTLGRKNRRQ